MLIAKKLSNLVTKLWLKRLGPKDHSSLFTGSPNLTVARKVLGGKKSVGQSAHPALESPRKDKRGKKNTSASPKANLKKDEHTAASGLKTVRKY